VAGQKVDHNKLNNINMKLSEIINFLRNNSNKNLIQIDSNDEIDQYIKSSKTKGASMSIFLTEDINNVIIGKHELRVLCNAYLNGYLNEFYLSYIVDVLLLSQKVSFESEDVEDDFSLLTDPEINGDINKRLVLDLLIKNSQ
jgi:hypothetical protein